MKPVHMIHTFTDSSRFRLLQLFLEQHYCVKALVRNLEISESAGSRHMLLLKRCPGYPTHTAIQEDFDCSCKYISDWIKRDSKLLEEQKYGK